ncbi:MAG: tetratricopeptide repeat protein [Alphaproteobacteria bacterium]|nr:tetratricopeptide repeat protein [Alphaproteobacteria bacterium]
MNRAQRRQTARSTKKARKQGVALPAAANMTSDIVRDMEIAVGFHQAGELTRAANLYQSVLDRYPDLPDALNFLGIIASDMGQSEKALSLVKRSLTLDPANAVYHNNHGNILRQIGSFPDAVDAYRNAIRYAPAYAVAYNNLGIALNRDGHAKDAESAFRRAIEIEPQYFDAYNNLGTGLYLQARFDEAATVFRKAVSVAPKQPSARNNLANVLAMLGKIEEAECVCRDALEIDNSHAISQVTLGGVLEAQGQFFEAEIAFRTALDLNADMPAAWNNLGNLFRVQGSPIDAINAFRRAIAMEPGNAMAHSNLLFSLALDPEVSPLSILAEARNWNTRHAAPLTKKIQPNRNKPVKDRRLRVGYVSPDFHDHAVARFLTPLYAAHDRQRVEIFSYADVARIDNQTRWFEQHSNHWCPTFGMADAQLAEKIRRDGIDVLIDVTGHTAGNRLLAFAEKPAPVQASWLGYGGSTGMDAMGWRITDSYIDPVGNDTHYCEELIRLPNSLFCYAPDENYPEIRCSPIEENGFVTFGSLNNFSKINDRTLRCWASILAAVPNARMVIKGRGLGDPQLRQRVLGVFAAKGVMADRLDLFDHLPEKHGHLSLFSKIDVMLDSFPYSGATTVCESLWMGVPTITIAGDRYVSRMASGVLNVVGLSELIAEDERTYVACARSLAAAPVRVATYRETMRERAAASPLADQNRFVAAMEDAIRHMWCKWCDEVTPHG